MSRTFGLFALAGILAVGVSVHAEEKRPDNTPPAGFTALFNGKDVTGWQGAIQINQRVEARRGRKAGLCQIR